MEGSALRERERKGSKVARDEISVLIGRARPARSFRRRALAGRRRGAAGRRRCRRRRRRGGRAARTPAPRPSDARVKKQ
eukprot:5658311-Pleurochrysis_carterae.AAC.1